MPVSFSAKRAAFFAARCIAPRRAVAVSTVTLLAALTLSGSIHASEVVPGVSAPSEESAPAARPSSIAAFHSDLKFTVATPTRADATDDGSLAAVLGRQSSRLAATLASAAQGLYPHMMSRIGKFDVYVADSSDFNTRSSSTGKIALNAGLGALRLTDDALAFVIAREMGHVLAGHHEDNSTASLVTSILMNVLLPGSSLIKSALSMASSEIASASGSERQTREADEIAVRLLETAGYRMRNLAMSLATDPADDQMGSGGWAESFRKSAAQIMAKARLTPAVPVASAPEAAASPVVATAAPDSRAGLSVARVPYESLTPWTRPSGIAGPLLLGGHAVPPRRQD